MNKEKIKREREREWGGSGRMREGANYRGLRNKVLNEYSVSWQEA